MRESSCSVGGPALAALATRQAGLLRRHLRMALAAAAATVALAGLMSVALRDAEFAAAHPGSIALDAAFVALLLVMAGSAAAQAVFARRVGRLAVAAPPAVACRVERLPAASGMRRDYLLVRQAGRDPVLVRLEPGAGAGRLPASGPAALLAAARFGPVVIVPADLPPIVGRAGRYERLLPRDLRADWVRTVRGAGAD